MVLFFRPVIYFGDNVLCSSRLHSPGRPDLADLSGGDIELCLQRLLFPAGSHHPHVRCTVCIGIVENIILSYFIMV